MEASIDQLARALGGKTMRELIDLRDKEVERTLLRCKSLRLVQIDKFHSSFKKKKPTRVMTEPQGFRVEPSRDQAAYRLYLRQRERPKLSDLMHLSPQLVLSLLIVILILPCSCQLSGSKNKQATSNQQSADVILSTAFSDQVQEKGPTRMQSNQFKYHLNHLRPPSLVPITIQQVANSLVHEDSGTGGQQPLLAMLGAWQSPKRRWLFEASNRSEPEVRQRLVQLQLPLQLHLKLRPLPLPMPPPLGKRDASGQEKRRRSLDEPESEVSPAELEKRHLMALTWREAKRVLLLNSMSPALLQVRLERRTAQIPEDTTMSPTSTTTTRMPNEFVTKLANNSALISTQAIPNDEVRRQRHSSQQLQGQSNRLVEPSLSQVSGLDSSNRIQALAASMLPFFWPSFQLSGSLAQRRAGNLLESQQQNSSSPMAASNQVPTIVSPNADERPVTPTPTRRKKARKPGYLLQVGAATPYPDSTRLASKYQMPRIKLQLAGGANPKSRRIEGAKEAQRAQLAEGKLQHVHVQVPKSLSKLIELQLMANASNLLQQHKSQSNQTNFGLAPTTSISRVVRVTGQNQTEAPEVRTTTPSPTTTTTTAVPAQRTTTREPNGRKLALVQDEIGSNKVVPEEEDQQVVGKRVTTKRPSLLSASGQAPKKYGLSQTTNKNIKLFHFKRKPDMNKLPFYKKPLNFTELGWNSKQIQEYLESLSSADDSVTPNSLIASPEAESRSDLLLLKRKRRGKSQFERLMAELHGGSGNSGESPTESPDSSGSSESDVPEALPTIGHIGGDSEDRVPVLRKKTEPLVMKPMFFVMNQKRRVVGMNKQNGTVPEMSSTVAPDGAERALNKSKPIIRMRRKHHGDQPLIQLRSPELAATPWRPSRPFLVGQRVVPAGERLLLVPSGLLTPSGSQVLPLFTPTSEHANWPRPNEANPKPSGGLAPNGEESFLVAPTSSSKSAGERLVPLASTSALVDQSEQVPQMRDTLPATVPMQPAPSAAPNATAGRRVPRLLVKPMRPAKYSLNGYIPKPSLNQQQLQQSQAQQLASPQLVGQTTRGKSTRPSNNGSSTNNNSKDLDSSTSNEIFSRRRGLQQHQRAAQAKALISFNSLLQSNPANQTAISNHQQVNHPLSAQQKQLEENKRKYIVQQSKLLLKSAPTLSIQKANLIKAKLGLIVSTTTTNSQVNGRIKTDNSRQQTDQQEQHSTNSITSDQSALASANAVTITTNDDDNPTSQANQLIGAPLNSIPKTDFECTDRKGKFIAGLFADFKTGCQVWHLCSNNRKYSFLCPTGTIFNANLRICDWRYNVKCEKSPLL